MNKTLLFARMLIFFNVFNVSNRRNKSWWTVMTSWRKLNIWEMIVGKIATNTLESEIRFNQTKEVRGNPRTQDGRILFLWSSAFLDEKNNSNFQKETMLNWAQQLMPMISVTGRIKQEDCLEFKASLSNIMRLLQEQKT